MCRFGFCSSWQLTFSPPILGDSVLRIPYLFEVGHAISDAYYDTLKSRNSSGFT